MSRQRINPHAVGTPERLLFDKWRHANRLAISYEREASRAAIDASAERAKADRYAVALDALGCPPPGYQKLLEGPK